MSRIKVMFDPKTIALIGATEKEGAIGRTILENLLRSKERKIFPVNPRRSRILDVESYPSITGVPEHVDLAVVATPARADVLTENERMLNVLRRLGFTTRSVPGGTSEAVLKLKKQMNHEE